MVELGLGLRLPASSSAPRLNAKVLEHLPRPCLRTLHSGHGIPVPPSTKEGLLSEILSSLSTARQHVRLTLEPPPRSIEEGVETRLVPHLAHSGILSPFVSVPTWLHEERGPIVAILAR